MSRHTLGQSPPLPDGIGIAYSQPLYLGAMGIYEGSNYWDESICFDRRTQQIRYLKAVFGKDTVFLGYGNAKGGGE